MSVITPAIHIQEKPVAFNFRFMSESATYPARSLVFESYRDIPH